MRDEGSGFAMGGPPDGSRAACIFAASVSCGIWEQLSGSDQVPFAVSRAVADRPGPAELRSSGSLEDGSIALRVSASVLRDVPQAGF